MPSASPAFCPHPPSPPGEEEREEEKEAPPEGEGKRQNFLKALWPWLSAHKGLLCLQAGASLMAAMAAGAWAWALGPLLGSVLNGKAAYLGPWEVSPEDFRWKVPLFLVLLALWRAGAQFLNAGWVQTLVQRVVFSLRTQGYARLLRIPPAWAERRHSGEVVSHFLTDLGHVEATLAALLPSLSRDLAQVAILLGVCAYLDFKLFLLAFALLPLVVLPLGSFKRAIRTVAKNSLGSLATLNTLLAETLSNLSIVKAFGMQPHLQSRFATESARFMSALRRSLFLRGAISPFTEYLGILGAALCIWVGVPAVAKEPSLAQHLLSFLAAFLLLYQPLRALSVAFGQLSTGAVAWGRFMQLMRAPQVCPQGEPALPLQEALCFENVSVRFADGRWGLQGFSLRVPRGKKTALVGPTGAGKSSVLSLLLGFVQASEGRVWWDRQPLEALALPSLRKQLAWVPQEPLLLSGSVRENLCLGQEGESVSDEALWEVLRLSGAEHFIKERGGLEAEVGERGAQLSGGQRQRLCIARALLREASVVLLDEVTSSLDAESEARVLQGLKPLMGQERTVLMVAHRLSTVKEADWIVVMEEGQVKEEGQHPELLAAGGLYARLWKAQMLTSPTGDTPHPE